jgi:four helix bundle protein
MSRDHRKLHVFTLADRFVLDIYNASDTFPVRERYGLQSQIRRAAVSAVCNIVEGSARNTVREYLHFLHIATGSASEVEYLVTLAVRLRYLQADHGDDLVRNYAALSAGLRALTRSLESLRS